MRLFGRLAIPTSRAPAGAVSQTKCRTVNLNCTSRRAATLQLLPSAIHADRFDGREASPQERARLRFGVESGLEGFTW
jgi:hypothetical protein